VEVRVLVQDRVLGVAHLRVRRRVGRHLGLRHLAARRRLRLQVAEASAAGKEAAGAVPRVRRLPAAAVVGTTCSRSPPAGWCMS
jgi:hypothetical protein